MDVLENFNEKEPATKGFMQALLTNLKNDFEKKVKEKVKKIVAPLENDIRELKEQKSNLERRIERLEKKKE